MTIISCLVTGEDLTESRTLYVDKRDGWSEAAELMFAVASPMPSGSPFEAYLRELGWTTPQGCALFTQVNESETMSEFLNLVLSPGEERRRAPRGSRGRAGPRLSDLQSC